MVHEMDLQNEIFKKIKSGKQQIEMRLNNKKRQIVNDGDIIKFENVETEEKMYCKVKNVYSFKNFKKLYKFFDKVNLGYAENEEANYKDMLKFYSKKEVRKNGVVGIELSLSTFEEYSKASYEQKLFEFKNSIYETMGLPTDSPQNVNKEENVDEIEEIDDLDDFDDEDLDDLVIDDFSDYSDYNDD